MKFISWNVNGIRACVQKGFMDFFQDIDADILCIQESKMQEGQLELDTPGYYQYWNYAKKKGYSGTAVSVSYTHLDVYKRQGCRQNTKLSFLYTIQRDFSSFV